MKELETSLECSEGLDKQETEILMLAFMQTKDIASVYSHQEQSGSKSPELLLAGKGFQAENIIVGSTVTRVGFVRTG